MRKLVSTELERFLRNAVLITAWLGSLAAIVGAVITFYFGSLYFPAGAVNIPIVLWILSPFIAGLISISLSERSCRRRIAFGVGFLFFFLTIAASTALSSDGPLVACRVSLLEAPVYALLITSFVYYSLSRSHVVKIHAKSPSLPL